LSKTHGNEDVRKKKQKTKKKNAKEMSGISIHPLKTTKKTKSEAKREEKKTQKINLLVNELRSFS
jgi:hypothetical protein